MNEKNEKQMGELQKEKKPKVFVRYDEGAEMYSMRSHHTVM